MIDSYLGAARKAVYELRPVEFSVVLLIVHNHHFAAVVQRAGIAASQSGEHDRHI